MPAARAKRATNVRSSARSAQKTKLFAGSCITKPNACSPLHDKAKSNLRVDAKLPLVWTADCVAQTSQAPRHGEIRRILTLDEQQASRVTDIDIRRFLRDWESQRRTSVVHQDGLDTYAKVLRSFDTNSQFGPCIGISRSKRWARAKRLGLSPPLEVLAILLRASKKSNSEIERAYVDKLMNN